MNSDSESSKGVEVGMRLMYSDMYRRANETEFIGKLVCRKELDHVQLALVSDIGYSFIARDDVQSGRDDFSSFNHWVDEDD